MSFPHTELPNSFEISDIITLFKIHLNPHNVYPHTTYDFWLMCYIESGVYYLTVDGVSHALGPGDLFFKAPGETYEPHQGQTDCIVYQLAFVSPSDSMEYFRKRVFFADPKTTALAQDLFQKGTKLFYWNGDTCSSSGMSVFPDTSTTDLYTVKLMVQLLLSTLHAQNTAPAAATLKKQADDRDSFSLAVSYMRENLANPISVSDVAAEVGISISALKKLFSQKCGCGVMAHFSKLRIAHAKKLLHDGLSMQELADALGFSSASNFSRWFKKETGIPPTQYRS